MICRVIFLGFSLLLASGSIGASQNGQDFVVSDSITSEQRQMFLHFRSYGPMSESEAHEKIRERLVQLDDLMAPAVDPYTGRSKSPDFCKKSLLPEVKKVNTQKQSGYSYSFYSSGDSSGGQVLGLCINKNDLLKTQYLLLYCRSKKKLLFITYFYSAQSPWLQEPVAQCL